MIHAQVDWSKVGSEIYSYWFVGASFAGFVAWLYRSRIGRQARRFTDALRSAAHQVRKIESLTDSLTAARAQADDWRARFGEMEERYKALQAEILRLGEDMHEFRKRMTTAEMLVRVLTHDRDELIDFSRLLIGQLYTGGHTPDYPTPALSSMVDVPGPPLPPYPEVKA
jgi:hypothetical protein